MLARSYLRASTDEQDATRARVQVETFAAEHGLTPRSVPRRVACFVATRAYAISRSRARTRPAPDISVAIFWLLSGPWPRQRCKTLDKG